MFCFAMLLKHNGFDFSLKFEWLSCDESNGFEVFQYPVCSNSTKLDQLWNILKNVNFTSAVEELAFERNLLAEFYATDEGSQLHYVCFNRLSERV